MRVRQIKLVLGIVAAVAALSTCAMALGGLAGGLVFFSSGADPASSLNETTLDVDSDAIVRWLDDATGLPRDMEPAARTAVTAGYLSAWDRRTGEGDPATLAGPAAAAIPATPDPALVEVDTAHELHLVFYSADGQLVAFDARATVSRRAALQGTEWNQTNVEHYTVVMILVDGSWRLRHWVRHQPAQS